MGGVRDGYSNFKFFEALAPQSFAGAGTAGASVDKQGYETLTFVVHAGEISGIASNQESTVSCAYFRMQHGTSNAAGTVVWSNCSAEHILVDLRLSDDGTVLGLATGLNTSGYTSTNMAAVCTNSAGSGIANGTFFCIGGLSGSVGAGLQSWWESKAVAAGYIGDHRWVRVNISTSTVGDVSALGVGAIAILGLEANWPVNTVRRTS